MIKMIVFAIIFTAPLLKQTLRASQGKFDTAVLDVLGGGKHFQQLGWLFEKAIGQLGM